MIQRSIPLYVQGRTVSFDIYDGERGASRGALIFLHGGGFVGGSKEQFIAMAASIALETDFICISLDYSLAPEHVYPTQVQDVFAICEWIKTHTIQLSIDENRIVLLGGSPGGCIAAMAVLSEAHETVIPLNHAILLNPILNIQEFAEMNPQERSAVLAFMPDRAIWSRNSPSALAKKNAIGKSFLILHGQNDQIVPISQSHSFAADINAFGGDAKVIAYPNEEHAWFNALVKHPDVICDIVRYLEEINHDKTEEK